MPGTGVKIEILSGFAPVLSNPFTVLASGGGGIGGPNRPANYNTIIRITGDYITPGDNIIHNLGLASAGGVGYSQRNGGALSIVNRFGRNWWRTHWPINHASGTGVVTVQNGNNPSNPTSGIAPYNYDNYYSSMWYNPGGDLLDYENGTVGTKICMMGAGTSSQPQAIVPVLDQQGSLVATRSAWKMTFEFQGVGPKISKAQNINNSPLIISGQPNLLEFLFHQNSAVDATDGTLEIWVNDTKIMDYGNMPWRVSGATTKFYGHKFYQNRVGLNNSARTRADDIDYSDIVVATL